MEAEYNCDFDYHDRKLASCSGKQAFPTHGAADMASDRQRRRGIPSTIYHCRFCHSWHVGRPNKSGRRL